MDEKTQNDCVKTQTQKMSAEIRKLISAETEKNIKEISLAEVKAHRETVESTFSKLRQKSSEESNKKIAELKQKIADVEKAQSDLIIKFESQKQSAYQRKEVEINARAKVLAENKYLGVINALNSIDNEAQKI